MPRLPGRQPSIQKRPRSNSAPLPSELPDPERLTSLLAFDVETSGLAPDDGSRVSVVSLAFRLDGDPTLHNFAYPFGQGPDDDLVDLGPFEWDALLNWMHYAGAHTGLVGHNANFDVIHLLAGANPGYSGSNFNDLVVFDTMAAAERVWPLESRALKSIAVRLFGEDADAEKQALKPYLGPKTNARFDRVPWPIMEPYARRDTELTLLLTEYLAQSHIRDLPQYAYVQRELDVARALVRMEVAGLPYDVAGSRQAEADLKRDISAIRDALPFSPTIPKTKQFYFEDANTPVDLGKGPIYPLGLKPRARTATGAPQLTAEDLERMAKKDLPHARDLQVLRRYESANSKWYKGFADKAGVDGRIRTQFRQFGTATGEDGGTKSGRFSVSRINLQAVPKDYALHLPVPTPRQFIARAAAAVPGWSLYDLDLAQAELRTAALDANCETMLDAIRNGRDAHGETAEALFQTPPDHPDFKVNRQIAKRANFSLIFGSGPNTFQSMVERESGTDFSLAEARRVVYGWRELYPEFGSRIDHWMEFARFNGYVPLSNGKHRYYRPGEDWHSAFNQRIQGSLAEYAKEWLLATDSRLRPYHLHPNNPARYGGLLLVVHDSQVLFLPDDYAEETIEAIRQEAREIWSRWFPGVPGDVDATPWG